MEPTQNESVVVEENVIKKIFHSQAALDKAAHRRHKKEKQRKANKRARVQRKINRERDLG